MSVIVKGMKKPSNCIWIEKCVGYKCPLLNDEDCCNLQDCKEEWTWADQYAGCPLVELPEKHGRLIDGDAVFDWYIKAFNSYPKIEPNEVRFSMNDIAGNLLNMPTIIEAEEGE